MHLLVHAGAAGIQLLAVARHTPPDAMSGLTRLLTTATRAAADSQTGRFTLVGDLLFGGILLIACGAFGLRRSR